VRAHSSKAWCHVRCYSFFLPSLLCNDPVDEKNQPGHKQQTSHKTHAQHMQGRDFCDILLKITAFANS